MSLCRAELLLHWSMPSDVDARAREVVVFSESKRIDLAKLSE